MQYNKFIDSVHLCPFCNLAMIPEKLDIVRGFYPDKFIIAFNCQSDGHYESYCCIKESNKDEVRIDALSFQIRNFSASWFNETKELCVRNPGGDIFFKKVFKDKTFEDWVFEPHKNIIDKVNSLMILL